MRNSLWCTTHPPQSLNSGTDVTTHKAAGWVSTLDLRHSQSMMLFLDTPNTRAVALSPCPSVRAFNTSMTRLNGFLKPAIGAFEGITEIAITTKGNDGWCVSHCFGSYNLYGCGLGRCHSMGSSEKINPSRSRIGIRGFQNPESL